MYNIYEHFLSSKENKVALMIIMSNFI